MVNKYLLAELMEAGIWSDGMKQEIVARNGSVQGIAKIPAEIQARYKTGWELKQRCLIDMAAARGAFIDQSQSLNLFVADPNYAKLTSMHFHAWKNGLKTGCYYLRTKAPIMAQKFTVDPRLLAAVSGGVASASAGGAEDEGDGDESSDDDDEASSVSSEEEQEQEQQKKKDIADFRKRLAEAKAAAEAGEDCLMCGS
jgi:ribonucleotide reductase alpha subunit